MRVDFSKSDRVHRTTLDDLLTAKVKGHCGRNDDNQAEFKAAQHKPAPVHAADREIERLRGELSKARDDGRHHEQLTRAYALIINQLTEELEATKAERDALLDTPAIARLPRRLPI